VITFRAPRTGIAIVDDALQDVERVFLGFRNTVSNDHLISVTFAAASTDTPVVHGLGAPVRTFEVVDRTADVRVWRSSSVNSRSRDVIILQASAAATVLVRFV
jgi:hypothetical protein